MNSSTRTWSLLIVSALLSSSTTFLISKNFLSHPVPATPTMHQHTATACNYSVHRAHGYRYIKPIQYVETDCESPEFIAVKSALQNQIGYYKSSGYLSSASVYLRNFEQNNWMGINDGEHFHPGSLMKIALMITFLKQEEKHPGFLKTRLRFSKKPAVEVHQTFNSKQIESGKSYSIAELLKYTIAYSDNNATMLLHSVTDLEEYKKTFDYIGLKFPDVKDRYYSISASEYAIFFRILYNAGYLSPELSEMAIGLLSECDFNLGLRAGFPQGITIAHKFGEWANSKYNFELHESGIIYLNNKTYLLVIMTKGADVEKLVPVISELSKTVYTNLNHS